MVDAEDHDFALGLVDPVQNSVRAAPGRVDAGEVPTQLLSDTLRFLDQDIGEELDDGSRYSLWKPGLDGSDSGWGQDELVVGLAHDRRARTASTPRTTSPAA